MSRVFRQLESFQKQRREMQYLLAEFAEPRGVIIDDVREGMTNQVIELEEGYHLVTLDPPPDFSPEAYELILRKTSELSPRVIRFEKN
jgi:hypothetical protein